MRNIYYFFVGLCLLLFSCSTSKSDKPLLVEKIEPDMEIYQFSDGTFFSDIKHMESSGDYVYITERKLNKIYKVNNTDFSVATTIGKAGRGPGEFLHMGSFDINNDSLFIVSSNARGFAFFDNDKYSYNLPLDEIDAKFLLNTRGSNLKNQYYNGYIYYCPATAIETIYKYNIDTGINETFVKTDRKDIMGRYGSHVRCDKDRVYVVADNSPNIKIFDYNGNLLKEKDMTLDTIFKYSVDSRIEDERNNPNITISMFNDVQLKDQKLYCVTWLMVKDDTRKRGARTDLQLLIFDTKDDIKLIRRLNLMDKNLLNVCLTDKYLWSFSQNNGCIYRFDRKKYDL